MEFKSEAIAKGLLQPNVHPKKILWEIWLGAVKGGGSNKNRIVFSIFITVLFSKWIVIFWSEVCIDQSLFAEEKWRILEKVYNSKFETYGHKC